MTRPYAELHDPFLTYPIAHKSLIFKVRARCRVPSYDRYGDAVSTRPMRMLPQVKMHRAATPDVHNRSIFSQYDNRHLSPWKNLTSCNTASKKPPPWATWGEASLTPPLLTRTQASPRWPHPGLQGFLRWNFYMNPSDFFFRSTRPGGKGTVRRYKLPTN